MKSVIVVFPGHSHLYFLILVICTRCAMWLLLIIFYYIEINFTAPKGPGHEEQLVTCLSADASLTADPGVASSNPTGPILSWRLIMKIILWSFSSLPLNHSRRVVVSYKRKNVHDCLFKLAQEKV